jgi:serine/threonine protein phosphatase 1
MRHRCRFILVRENLEEMLFAALESDSELRSWLDLGGEATLKYYPHLGGDEFIDPVHVQFLKSHARDYFETDDFIFVHASYDPNKPMSEQSNTTCQWEHVQPEKMRQHYSGKTLIAGHTPQVDGNVLDLGLLKVIDTDSSSRCWLTAIDFVRQRVLQATDPGAIRQGT